MKAILLKQTGGPEQLQLAEVEAPVAGPKQALVAVKATGVNFIDVYIRTGLYKAELPLVPGMEAAGVVTAVGGEVTDIQVGDRVAYAMTRGSYADFAVVNASNLIQLPTTVSFAQGAAAMLQGMTAHYLTHSTVLLKHGDTVLVQAAAGGAGRLIVQMAKMLGARVIGTASTEAKATIARKAGCDEVIRYTENDFEEETRRLTSGKGVDVVYDSVGATTFLKGLNVIRPRGLMVIFGQSSGPVAPIDLNILNPKGSLYVTRPTLAHYTADRAELEWRAGDVLKWIGDGRLKLHVDRTYPLAEAAQAHRDLEARKTAGKLLLTVEG